MTAVTREALMMTYTALAYLQWKKKKVFLITINWEIPVLGARVLIKCGSSQPDNRHDSPTVCLSNLF